MRPVFTAVIVLTALAPAAWADPVTPNLGTPVMIPHVQDERVADSQSAPYPMRYSDEAGQKLGMRDGQWEAFKSSNTSIGGGLGPSGPMLTLQWRPN